MAYLHELKTYASDRGTLTVLENLMPGTIQRVFYIHGAGSSPRAGHRHQRAWNALVCLSGHCRVYSHNGREEITYILSDPQQCLVLEPEDWHITDRFSADAILLVVSNEAYDRAEYIYEPYSNSQYVYEPALAHLE
ncbi:FdtA/QdtA family cupin domain-containing protein [Spirosoma taeanense]|uniref:FdtA/QdtA family cupin domain-containing protein n=1 Tax=Spirosoma taeanense TaxID=2735870 RepID=A0A6M5Y4U0_9BACT|nr:FdtA/QdtA family cupin domain-containing protein [Spirosoma taeanense]QJW88829.1 FdtA/QdtA family cupin domain-containing protein [Spirosoma taeanense]